MGRVLWAQLLFSCSHVSECLGALLLSPSLSNTAFSFVWTIVQSIQLLYKIGYHPAEVAILCTVLESPTGTLRNPPNTFRCLQTSMTNIGQRCTPISKLQNTYDVGRKSTLPPSPLPPLLQPCDTQTYLHYTIPKGDKFIVCCLECVSLHAGKTF